MKRRDFLRTAGGVAGGAAAVSGAGTAAAAEEGEGGGGSGGTPDFGGYIDGAKGGSFEDMRGNEEVTVEVGGGSEDLAFLPTGLWIDPGTTVTFEWVSNGHNVLPEEQPDGAGWEGSGQALENEGFSYTHTFDTAGIYKYYCSPHEQLGMLGAIAVGDDVPTVSTGGGGGSTRPTVPDSAKSLGLASLVAMTSTLGLAYFFLKYGGSGVQDG
jgi:halocyanin-like protein